MLIIATFDVWCCPTQYHARELRWLEQLVEIKHDKLLSPLTFLSWYFPEHWSLNSIYFKTNKTTKTNFSDSAKWSEVSQRLNKPGLAGLVLTVLFLSNIYLQTSPPPDCIIERSVRERWGNRAWCCWHPLTPSFVEVTSRQHPERTEQCWLLGFHNNNVITVIATFVVFMKLL